MPPRVTTCGCVIKTNAGQRSEYPREHSDLSPENLLATETGTVHVEEVVEKVPVENHLAVTLEEVRNVNAPNASPSEDGLSGKMPPKKLDTLDLNGLEFGEVGTTGQKTGLREVRKNFPTRNPPRFLFVVEP